MYIYIYQASFRYLTLSRTVGVNLYEIRNGYSRL